MSYEYKYPRPAVTADCIVFTRESTPKVLLIERGTDPYKGCWAFSGGFMNMDETTEQCAVRELKEETGLEVTNVQQIGANSNVDCDPRGRTITIAYLALVDVPIEVKGQNATSTLRDSKKVAKQGKQLRNEYENSRMSIKDYRANISELLYKYKILIKD